MSRLARPALRGSLLLAAFVVIADQITKHWALSALSDGRERHVIWTLQWNLHFNSGMAFGKARGFGPVLGALAFIVVVALLLTLRNEASRLGRIAVGLVLGGAIGNLLDRLFREQGWLRGRVVDFIDFQWFPIFNIADMAVTIGGILLVLGTVIQARAFPPAGVEPSEVHVPTPNREGSE